MLFENRDGQSQTHAVTMILPSLLSYCMLIVYSRIVFIYIPFLTISETMEEESTIIPIICIASLYIYIRRSV